VNTLDSNANTIAGFIYRGQLAGVAIDHLSVPRRESGELTFDEVAKRLSLADLDPDLVASATKMSAVYIAIASFENMVRELISKRLLEEKGASWWDTAVSGDIKKRAQARIEEEEKIRWHKSRGQSPIYFTELGDLISIIQQNWGLFEDLLPDIAWVRQVIKTIERSRNVIMHSGELSLEDIERVGVNIRDWIRQVGT